MKKLFVTLFLCTLFSGLLFAEGSVIKIKPENFRDSIIICNESEKDFQCYLFITYNNQPEHYKSKIIEVDAKDKEKLSFDFDSEWHDLVRDIKKVLKTSKSKASNYDFELHFSEDNIVLDRTRVTGEDFEIYLVAKDDSF